MKYNLTFTIQTDPRIIEFIAQTEAKNTVCAIRKGLTIVTKLEGWSNDFENMEIEVFAVRPKQGRLI